MNATRTVTAPTSTALAPLATTKRDTVGHYRSGVAARLAGIPVDTLRVWERRYGVVGPGVSAGRQRLYSAADVRRLTLIKQLVDMGHPIGTIASLDDAALAAMRSTGLSLFTSQTARALPEDKRQFGIALVGPLLNAQRLEQTFTTDALQIVARCPDPHRAAGTLQGTAADLVIIEISNLGEPEVALINDIKTACGAAMATVLYRFAPGAIIRRLRQAGHAVARATSDPAEIEAICLSLLRPARSNAAGAVLPLELPPSAAPRFDEHALAWLSTQTGRIACECPRHLVDIVMSLAGFERYSAQCASRNAGDVALHLALQKAAGAARGVMEQALVQLVEQEGIVLPQKTPA